MAVKGDSERYLAFVDSRDTTDVIGHALTTEMSTLGHPIPDHTARRGS